MSPAFDRAAPQPSRTETHFTGRADVYARFGLSYPSSCARFLVDKAGLRPSSLVADIGAGTGIFTHTLLKENLRVIAVEPNEEMREEADCLLSGYNRYTSRAGWAEDTGLPDASVDLVTAAQAFPWFDKPRFREECRRILRSSGYVAVLWHHRETDNELVHDHDAICRRLCPRYQGPEAGWHESLAVFGSFFRNGAYVRGTFRNDIDRDWPAYLGANLSSTYTPRPEEPQYRAFVEAMRELFDTHQTNGYLRVPTVTQCCLGRV